jgi:hypothetical protein
VETRAAEARARKVVERIVEWCFVLEVEVCVGGGSDGWNDI